MLLAPDSRLLTPDFHDAVGDQAAVAAEQNDVTGFDLAGIVPVNQQNVPRPHGGQHAGTLGPETHFPKGAYHFRRQFAGHHFFGGGRAGARGGRAGVRG